MRQFVFLIFIISIISSCKDENSSKKINESSSVKNELPEAIKDFIIKAEKDSSNMEIQLKTVNILDSLGFKKDALIKLDQLISKDSLNNEYWLKRGQLCKYLEDTVAAIKAFRFAARVYPTPISLMELANLYAETKNIKTISIANQLMKIYPDGKFNAEANFFIAVYYSKMNDAANAIKVFNSIC